MADNECRATWWVYMIACADGSLYTGVATDVARRFAEHQAQGSRTARYLRGRAPLQLVFSRPVTDRATAQRIEYRIKQLPRVSKMQLIDGELSWTGLLEQTVHE